MDDVRGDFFRAVTRHNTSCSNSKYKLKLRSFKSSEHINEKGDGPYPLLGTCIYINSYCEAGPRLCFRIGKKPVFSCRDSDDKNFVSSVNIIYQLNIILWDWFAPNKNRR